MCYFKDTKRNECSLFATHLNFLSRKKGGWKEENVVKKQQPFCVFFSLLSPFLAGRPRHSWFSGSLHDNVTSCLSQTIINLWLTLLPPFFPAPFA